VAFKRFLAPTARMAMEAVKREFGDDAVILSNKRLGDQIEILAAAGSAVDAIVESEIAGDAVARTRPAGAQLERARAKAPLAPPISAANPRPRFTAPAARIERAASLPAPVAARRAPRFDAMPDGAAMYASVAASPQVVEDEVRNWNPPRWNGGPGRQPLTRTAARPAPTIQRTEPRAEQRSEPRVDSRAETRAELRSEPRAELRADPRVEPRLERRMAQPDTQDGEPAVFRRRPSRAPDSEPAEAPREAPATAARAAPDIDAGRAPAAVEARAAQSAALSSDPRVMAELESMRTAFSAQIAALGSNLASTLAAAARVPSPPASPAPASPLPASSPTGTAPASAATVHVLMRLLTSGFSAALARHVAQRAPQGSDLTGVDDWLSQVIAANVKCVDPTSELFDAGGAVALIGPTGVGKTTTLAKIAARFVVRHGAAKLGLITLDSYRVGAHEQLRTYGRILGAPVQVAHDAATLQEMLAAMRGRKLVLIDTCGMSQRDDRVGEILAMLDAARFGELPVRRLLLLSAALHVETLDEVARSWRAAGAMGAVLTKIDEAARCGAALDCVMRHQLTVMGLTNGQRVPEDWHAANARMLAHVALKPARERFDLNATDVAALTTAASRDA
jgi:flagellar biosynthesis protein FlhF